LLDSENGLVQNQKAEYDRQRYKAENGSMNKEPNVVTTTTKATFNQGDIQDYTKHIYPP
jgi:hypothetical protein